VALLDMADDRLGRFERGLGSVRRSALEAARPSCPVVRRRALEKSVQAWLDDLEKSRDEVEFQEALLPWGKPIELFRDAQGAITLPAIPAPGSHGGISGVDFHTVTGATLLLAKVGKALTEVANARAVLLAVRARLKSTQKRYLVAVANLRALVATERSSAEPSGETASDTDGSGRGADVGLGTSK
jgi:hypothetical protein